MIKSLSFRIILFSIFFIPVFWSCSGKIIKSANNQEPVVFPQPPDTTRIQFLTSFSNSIDITGQRSPFMRYVLGNEPGKPIHKPYGLKIHNGKIYICDTMLPGLEIIDLQKQEFEYFTPSGLGQLKKPLNCCIDKKGHLYVADAARKQVVHFDAEGTYLSTIGDRHLAKPTDVLVYQDKIWVCDLGGHQMKVFDESNHKLLFSFPDTLQNRSQYLFSPTNIYVYDQKIYITDTGDARIKVFDKNGKFLKIIGSFGKKPGQFVRPKGLALDKEGFLYAVDAAFENVQIFDNQDQLRMFFGGSIKGPGQMWLPAGISIDYRHLDYFQKYIYPKFELKYLIFVTNQYGPARVNVYGFVQIK